MLRVIFCCLIVLSLSAGCLRTNPREVVVYAALDKEFSEPLLEEFGKQTGVKVLGKYDVESNKTVGLANEIIANSSRPRGDVFWNNEILHTLRLEKLGLLETYRSPLAEKYPPQFVSKEGRWHGFAARARVLIINRKLLPDQSAWPAEFAELADPRWKGKCGMARPLFGTTATHAAVLFAQLGDELATDFFKQVAENAVIESGNKQVAQHVAEGRYAWGVTDTDDAVIEIEAGKDVALVFPDQGSQGTLLIPNTLAIIKGGPNAESARKLVDWLLRSETEVQLAKGASAQIPLNREVTERSRVAPQDLKVMEVDFVAAAEKWESAQRVLVEIFR
ncbi:MAG: extracellular solute-binding protein [Planctomycetota bacterium]